MGKKKKPKYEEVEYYSLSPETKKGILIIFLFAVSLISVLAFLNLAGKAGIYIDWVLGIVFGWGRYIIPLILVVLGYTMARPNRYKISIPNYIGIFLFIVSVFGLLHFKLPATNSFELTFSGLGGGIIGYLISYPAITYLGFWGGITILCAIFVISFMLMFNTSIESILEKTNIFKLFSPFQRQESAEESGNEEVDEESEEDEELDEKETAVETKERSNLADSRVTDVKFSRRGVLEETKTDSYPKLKTTKINIDLPLNLLDSKQSKPTSGDIKEGLETIHRTLENFNIDVEMGEVQVGPTVTQYTLKPSEGIKLSRITALNNDLALALAAHPIRIEAPIPGKSLVGIEVPNKKPAIVRVHEVLNSPAFRERKSNLTVVLGKDVSGKCWVADLAKMPHLLVAGATGSGKSVCLNSLIISLLYQNTPETLRLLMVDPKRVEFPIYNGIPHLLTPVITDVTKTVYALRWAITEMDHRFDVLSKVNKKNIADYNAIAKEKLPYIVIIIDELADLMIAAAAEVEGCIIRLTQMARAVGIHLVVATQRPSVDVITGLIKANIPCRIAFSVASLMDSRTILDSAGAEKLVGKGDMLFMTPEASTTRRLQGTYLSDDEIKNVVNFLHKACGEPPEYNNEIVAKPSNQGNSSFDFNKNDDDDGGDELFDEAKDIVIRAGKASTSFLQRRLRIGYARAARLIDLLEDAGIVSAGDGAKPRDILVDKASAGIPTTNKSQVNIDEDIDEEETPDEFQDSQYQAKKPETFENNEPKEEPLEEIESKKIFAPKKSNRSSDNDDEIY
jgi:S-DNA-T family DNA segregation ATPase FtsK/SpoIIIE